MVLSISTKPTVNFDPSAMSGALKSNPSAVINHANRTGNAIQEAQHQVAGKIHAERNDGGQHGNNAGGALSFLNKATGIGVGIAAGVIGGPVGAALAAGSALVEGASFVRQAMAGPSEEKSSFVDYTRVKPGKLNARNVEDPIISSYTDSSGETYNYGFDSGQQKQLAQKGLMVGPSVGSKHDSIELRDLKQLHGTLGRKADDVREQGIAVQAYAEKNNIATENNYGMKDFAGGPKPPAGGPGFSPTKAMSFGI